MENEGYKKWLDKKKKQEKKDEQRKQFEHRLLEMQVKTFFLALIIGLIGGICGIIALCIKLKGSNSPQDLNNHIISKPDTISFSSQTKKVDSMPTSKTLIHH